MHTNPWRCLAAYKEPRQEDKKTFLFCGRDKESYELFYLIKKNLFVTLYGRTGIGKTSLLEAGVFPLLRKDNYIPIVVRFGMQDDTRKSFAEIVVSSIENQGVKIEKTIEDKSISTLEDGLDDIDFLWTYFATRHFYKGDCKVFPVVVLDQFEENLISSRKESKFLLEQIYSLIDDNKDYPVGYHSETNFRFVLSIREDDLYRLEETIDKSQLNEFKNNRYRLTHLSKECAKEVICKPGDELLPSDENERQAIIDGILKQSTDEDGDNINTLLLSLVCSCLYDRCVVRKANTFAMADIYALGNNLLVDFYNSLHIKKRTRRIIEEKFIDANGRRNAVNIDDLYISQTELDELCLGSKRILQKTNKRLELVHDLLAQAIFETKKKKKEKNLSQIFKIYLLVFFSVIFVLGLLRSVFIFSGTDNFNSIPVFSKTDCIVVDSSAIVSKNIFVEKLIFTGKNGNSHIYDCPNLKRIIIQTNTSAITINNCPNLRYLELPDSVGSIIITHCPQLRTLYLPHIIGYLDVDEKINVVPPTGSSKYIAFGETVWDVEHSRIIYSNKDCHSDSISVVFPLQLYKKNILWYKGVRFINNGKMTDDGFLVENTSPTYVYSCCDSLTYVDLSGKKVMADAFDNARDITAIKIDADTHFDGNHIFANNHNLHRVIICQSVDFSVNDIKNLLAGLSATPHPLIYELQGEGPLKKTSDGVIRFDKTPVLISAESKKNIEIAYSGDTAIVCMKAWDGSFVKPSDSSCNMISVYGHPQIVVDTFRIFNIPFLCNGWFRLMEDEVKDTPISKAGIIYCGKLSPKPRVFRLNTYKVTFKALSDSVKKEIILLVPYGQINNFIYNSTFDGFKDIREESLMQTLCFNALMSFEDAGGYLKANKGQLLLLIIIAIVVLLILYFLSYMQLRKYERKVIAVIKALYSSLSIVVLGLFTWISVYWFLWYWFFRSTRDNISSSIIALFFAVAVVGLMYKNLWLFVYQRLRKIKIKDIFREVHVLCVKHIWQICIIGGILTILLLAIYTVYRIRAKRLNRAEYLYQIALHEFEQGNQLTPLYILSQSLDNGEIPFGEIGDSIYALVDRMAYETSYNIEHFDSCVLHDIRAMSLSPNGKLLLLGNNKGILQVLDLDKKNPIHIVNCQNEDGVENCGWINDAMFLASTYGGFYYCNIKSTTPLYHLDLEHSSVTIQRIPM